MEIVYKHVVIALRKHAESRMVIATGDVRMDTGEIPVATIVKTVHMMGRAGCQMVIATADVLRDTGEQTVMTNVAARPSGHQSVIKYDVTVRTVTETLDVLFFVSM